MRTIPQIGTPGEPSDFHDSSLLYLNYNPLESIVSVFISTPNEYDIEEKWLFRLEGILELEMETLGIGENNTRTPPEIYDIYDDFSGKHKERWVNRLNTLGIKKPEVHEIIFASSFLRGWGEKNDLEGIRIVCRKYYIEPAPNELPRKRKLHNRIPSSD